MEARCFKRHGVAPSFVKVVGWRGGTKRVCRSTVASPCSAQGSNPSQHVLPLVQLPEGNRMRWGGTWRLPGGCVEAPGGPCARGPQAVGGALGPECC